MDFIPVKVPQYTPARAQRSPQQAVPQSWSANLVEKGQPKRELSRPPHHRTHQLLLLGDTRLLVGRLARRLAVACVITCNKQPTRPHRFDGSSLPACSFRRCPPKYVPLGCHWGATSGQSCTGMQPLVMTFRWESERWRETRAKQCRERNTCWETRRAMPLSPLLMYHCSSRMRRQFRCGGQFLTRLSHFPHPHFTGNKGVRSASSSPSTKKKETALQGASKTRCRLTPRCLRCHFSKSLIHRRTIHTRTTQTPRHPTRQAGAAACLPQPPQPWALAWEEEREECEGR